MTNPCVMMVVGDPAWDLPTFSWDVRLGVVTPGCLGSWWASRQYSLRHPRPWTYLTGSCASLTLDIRPVSAMGFLAARLLRFMEMTSPLCWMKLAPTSTPDFVGWKSYSLLPCMQVLSFLLSVFRHSSLIRPCICGFLHQVPCHTMPKATKAFVLPSGKKKKVFVIHGNISKTLWHS